MVEEMFEYTKGMIRGVNRHGTTVLWQKEKGQKLIYKQMFTDTKGLIGSRKSKKGRQYNGQRKRTKGQTKISSFHYTEYMAFLSICVTIIQNKIMQKM